MTPKFGSLSVKNYIGTYVTHFGFKIDPKVRNALRGVPNVRLTPKCVVTKHLHSQENMKARDICLVAITPS
jgi:hypothetical protein